MGLLWLLLYRFTGALIRNVTNSCWFERVFKCLFSSEAEKEKSVTITVEEPKAKRIKLNDDMEQEERTTQKRVCIIT